MATVRSNEYRWYAIYTRSRAEKKVNTELTLTGIETYLPLRKTIRQWSDRKKMVEAPLFNSYVFVKVSEKEYLKVLNTDGVTRFITFEGLAVAIPEVQINAIKAYLEEPEPIEETDDPLKMEPGQNIIVTRGPMKGLMGILITIQGKNKVKVEIEAIGHTLMITIPPKNIEIVGNTIL
ncbi:MAG: UpxY family transcription antiterminator [Bacteroidetes bacterium]|nr:UpxY family transcription antiterminator [Bacteroidota bacterium]